MEIIDYVVIAIFSYWFLATLLANISLEIIPSKVYSILTLSRFPLAIPVWTFFAPRPGKFDYYILYREVDYDGNFSNWFEMYKERRKPLLKMLWNPTRDLEKAILDVTIGLAREIVNHKDRIDYIALSVPYITILNLVSNHTRFHNTAKVQFTLFQKTSKETIEIFTSGIHRVS